VQAHSPARVVSPLNLKRAHSKKKNEQRLVFVQASEPVWAVVVIVEKSLPAQRLPPPFSVSFLCYKAYRDQDHGTNNIWRV